MDAPRQLGRAFSPRGLVCEQILVAVQHRDDATGRGRHHIVHTAEGAQRVTRHLPGAVVVTGIDRRQPTAVLLRRNHYLGARRPQQRRRCHRRLGRDPVGQTLEME